MRIGVTVPNSGALAASDAAVTLAVLAEQLGFDSVWVVDHLILPHQPSETYPYTSRPGVTLPADWAFLDPLIALAAIAARTERVQLGTGVYLMPLRHPVVAAKAAASLDVLSHGRLLLGVGLGWIREEYDVLGLKWAERGRLFDEQIDYVRALWRDASPDFRGEFWQAGGFGFEPKPVKRSIPLLIGGRNAPARRRAAARGDGWHLIDMSPDEVRAAHAALDRDCRAIGRDPAEVPISMYASVLILDADIPDDRREFPLMGSIGQIAATVADYGLAGVDHLVLAARGLGGAADYEALYRRIGDQIPPVCGQ